jgi:PEP-utilizing family enzyme
MGLVNAKLMVPFCRTPAEGRRVLDLLAANGLVRGVNGLEVYVMAEIPANAILVDEFAALFDGFSIGSNDLTQLVLGVDRDSGLVAPEFDERNPAVLRMIGMIIDGGARRTQGRDLWPGSERLPRDGPVPRGEGDHEHLAQPGCGGTWPRSGCGRGGRAALTALPGLREGRALFAGDTGRR